MGNNHSTEPERINYKYEIKHGLFIKSYDVVDHTNDAAATGFNTPAVCIAFPIMARDPSVSGTTRYYQYFDDEDGRYLGTHQNEAAEGLDDKGSILFQKGKYSKAAEYHNNAYLNCSSRYKNEQTFKNNRDRAQNEVDAINLNSQGDSLFNHGKYREAQQKYQEAYYKSQVSKEYNKYRANRDRAEAEVAALDLNSQGERLFIEGKYTEAQKKYQEAYDKSQVIKEYNKHRANRDRAETEVAAINLYLQGDSLFNEGKYGEALNKYQEAYDKSQITKEENVYKINKEKTQTIINKLSMIDGLWNKAWDAEENDRCEEAEKSFQQVLIECKNSLKLFPKNLKLKEYETLVSLKMEGNELFNQGLKLQQNGINLLKEAQGLKEKRKYESANIKFKEAKDKFIDAKNSFEKGILNDQRFVSCIEIVQDQINQIIQSIEITEEHALCKGVQSFVISTNAHRLIDDFCVTESIGEDKYHAQI